MMTSTGLQVDNSGRGKSSASIPIPGWCKWAILSQMTLRVPSASPPSASCRCKDRGVRQYLAHSSTQNAHQYAHAVRTPARAVSTVRLTVPDSVPYTLPVPGLAWWVRRGARLQPAAGYRALIAPYDISVLVWGPTSTFKDRCTGHGVGRWKDDRRCIAAYAMAVVRCSSASGGWTLAEAQTAWFFCECSCPHTLAQY
eukprot:1531132-Rhodomonas_salina.1